MTEQSEMSVSLLRQRRNLIIVNIVMLFILYTDVHISKITIFAIEFVAPSTQSLMNVLWGIWLYFLVRYYQYLTVEPAIGIKPEFYSKFRTIFSNTLLNNFIGKYPEYNLNVNHFSTRLLRRKSLLNWEFPILIYEPNEGTEVEISKESVSLSLLLPIIIKSSWYVFMHTPRVTDYAFPFLIAFITIAFGVIKLTST